jgi:hypothetical protein
MRPSVHARQESSQNGPALAERPDALIDETNLLGEQSAQIVARLEIRIVVLHAGQQLLDRFKRHPGSTQRLDPPVSSSAAP